jgi:hypothetical protein
MEKEHWFLRVSRWSWMPIVLGIVTGVGIVAALPAEAGAAAIGGLSTILFIWIAVVKGLIK